MPCRHATSPLSCSALEDTLVPMDIMIVVSSGDIYFL
jgi:hypothetical protein